MIAAQTHGLLRTLAQGVAALLIAGLASCAEPEPIELVAVRGCGLEQEFSGLRVRVLGDFPVGAGTELLLGPGERGTISALPEGATGVAAEGLFGTTTTAVGRSYGVDPTLARGRIAGLDDPDASALSLWFAAPDSACELGEQPSPRTDLAAALGPEGDVLIVGGRADQDAGAALDELVHVDLLADEVRTLGVRLPAPRRGASVHALADRRFLIVGGEQAGTIAADPLIVDVRGDGRLEPGALPPGAALDRADHAVALAPDGRVLVAGGCTTPAGSGECGAETGSALLIDLFAEPAAAVELPELDTPRAGAHALVSSDGVAYVAGGVAGGLELRSLERLRPGGAWEPVHALPDDRSVAGLAAIDGGLVLLADRSGAIHWWSEAGSGILDPSSRAPSLAPIPAGGDRPLLTLPGERVLVDGWLFAPASAAVDPALERVELLAVQRSGATPLGLADGSALILGGVELGGDDQAPPLAEPPLLRLRPELDGPDEWIPDLAGPQTDAFVSNAPDRATVIVGGLQLDGEGLLGEIPPVRAHVRGFRSRALRFEFEFVADPDTVAALVLGQGAEGLVSVALLGDGDELIVRRRDPSGALTTLDCALGGVDPSGSVIAELEDQGRRLRLSSGGAPIADCELSWASEAGVSVGFGVSGAGSARFFTLRLARR